MTDEAKPNASGEPNTSSRPSRLLPARDTKRRTARGNLARWMLRPARAGSAGLRGARGPTLLATLLLMTPPVDPRPWPDLTGSFIVALNTLRGSDLHHGPDIAYTYGPWGFLDLPLATSRANLVAAMCFAAFASAVAWFALDSVLRRALPPVWAGLAAGALIVTTTPYGEPSALLLVGVSLLVLDHVADRPGSTSAWVPAFAASCSALLLQVKFSEGAILALVVAIMCVLSPTARVRCGATALAGFTGAFLVSWTVIGQPLRDIRVWLSRSLEITRGYNGAMAVEVQPNAFSYLVAGILIVVLAGFLLRLGWRQRRRSSLGTTLIVGLITYFGFRQGFTRHDPAHESFFYFVLLVGIVWLLGVGGSKGLRTAIVVLVAVLASNGGLYSNPTDARQRWATATEVVTSPSFQQQLLAQARATMQANYSVSPELLRAMDGRPVHVDGISSGLPWAYGLTLVPAPVFQSYVAYTAELDQINADWLQERGPDQVVLHPPVTSIDGRNTLWDSPRYVLTELCETRLLDHDDRWLLLEHTASRCGAPRESLRTTVTAGQSIAVPRSTADQLVTMSFNPRAAGTLTRLLRTLNKSFRPLFVDADDTLFLLPRALADGPLVVKVPASVGWPDGFGGGTSYGRVTFSEAGTVTFDVREVT